MQHPVGSSPWSCGWPSNAVYYYFIIQLQCKPQVAAAVSVVFCAVSYAFNGAKRLDYGNCISMPTWITLKRYESWLPQQLQHLLHAAARQSNVTWRSSS